MYEHHKDTITNITKRFKKRKDVLALIVGGSIAHGFARENSDIDIYIVVSEEEYIKRFELGEIHYYDKEDCTYNEGYIDGKYISLNFLKKVSERGSEPARYAFQDAIICFSKIEGLENLLKSITRYPEEKSSELIRRFYAQFEAWTWYSHEAIKLNNEYLLINSISNMVLFGGRMILAYNQKLYPYHKWFMKVLKDVENKPENLIETIDNLVKNKTKEDIEAYHKCILEFTDWKISKMDWPSQFMMDSELNWLDGAVPIADI